MKNWTEFLKLNLYFKFLFLNNIIIGSFLIYILYQIIVGRIWL